MEKCKRRSDKYKTNILKMESSGSVSGNCFIFIRLKNKCEVRRYQRSQTVRILNNIAGMQLYACRMSI